MNIEQIKFGFKKEIWEFRKTLIWVPVIIASLILLTSVVQLLFVEHFFFDEILNKLSRVQHQSNLPHLANAVYGFMSGIFAPFIGVAFIIQLYFFTSCLFDERQDMSVIFWRSLPVSDAQTIITKLLTGALVIPAIFMLAATALILLLLVLFLVICVVLAMQYDISLWAFWTQADLISSLAAIWLTIIPTALWLFPIFAWLLLASMIANRAPFLWAVLPIVVILIVEAFFVSYFNLEQGFIWPSLSQYLGFAAEMFPHHVEQGQSIKLLLFSTLWSKVSVTATLLGCALLFATHWLRVNRSHA